MTTHEPAAILWDMDGTIVDTEPAWIRAEQALLKRWGLEMTATDATDWVGIGLWDLAEIFQHRGVDMTADEIVQWMTEHVNDEIFSGDLDWRPGARELAQAASQHGLTNVLVTMSTRSQAERIIALLPPGTFSGIVGGDDVDRPKPYPDPYLLGAKVAGVAPDRCIAIEDSITGATSAHRAGTCVIGVTHLLDLSEAPVDYLLDSLAGVSITDLMTLFQGKGTHD